MPVPREEDPDEGRMMELVNSRDGVS